METIEFCIKGVSPLLMNNALCADPLNPITVKLGEINKALKGKNRDNLQMREQQRYYDWLGRGYFDETTGPYIPGWNLEAVIRDGARMTRNGKTVQAACTVLQDKIPLQYEGPRDIKGLWEGRIFADIRPVKVQKNLCMRCRPLFTDWQLSFAVVYDEEMLNPKDIENYLTKAGGYVGLCDQRPRYGRFELMK